tara:strand:- start:362 stop:571 length:210 start_codon:yes stop_codon:yes gene_type:complete
MSLFFKSNNLSLGYGNQLVINNKDISLELSKNYEIVGKNGSGKTTLIMCISEILLEILSNLILKEVIIQ